jgi:hypothetical protein
MSASKLAGVIEVALDDEGEVPVDLLRSAYLASRDGTVILVLKGVSTKQVDRVLDPIVSQAADVAGVLYCTPSSLDGLLELRGWQRSSPTEPRG